MKPKHVLLIAAALLLLLLLWHNLRKSVWVRRIQAKYPDGDAKTWSTTEIPWSLAQLFGLYINGHPSLEPQPAANPQPTTDPDVVGMSPDDNY